MTLTLECDALLFDLDGVLIDSSSCIVRHWSEWAELNGLDLDGILRIAHGMRTIETMRLAAPHLDVEREAALFTAREVLDTEGVLVIPGAQRLLARLPAGRWAIVTSGSPDLVQARLGKAGLPLPGVLVTADDVRHGKPAPEPYLVGAQRLGADAGGCVVIEDAPAGVEAGKKAGMRVVGVASTHSRAALLAYGADFVVDRLSDLTVREIAPGQRLSIQIDSGG